MRTKSRSIRIEPKTRKNFLILKVLELFEPNRTEPNRIEPNRIEFRVRIKFESFTVSRIDKKYIYDSMGELYSLQVNGKKVTEIIGSYESYLEREHKETNPGSI
jgi:hypothetical protein